MQIILAILPEGSVRNETVFLILITALAALVGLAFYLRFRRRHEKNYE